MDIPIIFGLAVTKSLILMCIGALVFLLSLIAFLVSLNNRGDRKGAGSLSKGYEGTGTSSDTVYGADVTLTSGQDTLTHASSVKREMDDSTLTM